jgi:hypothetical protein
MAGTVPINLLSKNERKTHSAVKKPFTSASALVISFSICPKKHESMSGTRRKAFENCEPGE